MSARLGWFFAASLFTAAAALIAAGHPLVAAGLLVGVAYLAGRWDRRRGRDAVVAGLRAEVERKDARITDLEDHAIFHYDCQHLGRYAGDVPLMPDVGDRRDWSDVNRKPEAERAAAPVRATTTSNP
ncbi:hypothetical protein AB0K35_28450 [Micromonospora sp. NPDC053740]|uniref:hypothetical protein n=1 Tax=Micromonospora sp. NPDC053740 TaxID=3155173 RepID=UPI00341F083A